MVLCKKAEVSVFFMWKMCCYLLVLNLLLRFCFLIFAYLVHSAHLIFKDDELVA